MILSDAVAKLATLIPVLKSNDAKFASDLIASYKKYGGLTPKQEPWIERLIARAETPKPVFSAPLASAVNVGGFSGVVALINKAKESGLKFPKVRLVVNGTKVIISLNGPKSKKAGHVSISGEGTYPNRAFYGSVSPEGVFSPFKPLTGLAELLTEFASNPARVAKDHGKLLGHCCFCGKLVGHGEDKRSVHAGFGPDCAERYGLKAEWLKAVEKAEAKASVAPVKLSVQDEVKASLEAGFVQTTGLTAAEIASEAALEPVVVTLPTVEELANAPVSEEFTDSYGPNPGDVGDLEPVTTDDNPKDETVYDAPVVHIPFEESVAALVPEPVWSSTVTPETAVEWAASVTAKLATPVDCFFCEKPTANYKTLHGFVVCASCVDQLK